MDSHQSNQHQQSENNNNISLQEQGSTEGGHSHQPPPPVSPEHHPGAVGYAVALPEIPYPYPHNYQPYPSLPPNFLNQANYPHGQNYTYARHGTSLRFLLAIMVLAMILLVLGVTYNVGTIIIYQPEVPTFHVDAFSVSNFNASSSSGLASTWDVTLSVKNPNTKLRANFEGGRTYLYYQDKNVLAYSFIQPFEMETGEVTALTIRMEAGTGGNATVVPKDVVAEMADEKAATGAVVFELSVQLDATLKSGYYSESHLLDVDCNTLRVVFYDNGSSMNGSLVSGDNQRRCPIFGDE